MSHGPKTCSRCGGSPDNIITSTFAICNKCTNTLGIKMDREALADKRRRENSRGKEEPDEKG